MATADSPSPAMMHDEVPSRDTTQNTIALAAARRSGIADRIIHTIIADLDPAWFRILAYIQRDTVLGERK